MTMKNKAGISLPNVTLAAVTSVRVYETIKALQYSMREIEFGEVLLISHRRPLTLPSGIQYRHTDKLRNIDDFNYKMVYELGEYIHTDFLLLIHYDGFIVNPHKWQDEFLQYDYIGSPWPVPAGPHCYHDVYGNLCRVGNSVSLRSKRLLEYPKQAGLTWQPSEDGTYNEDIFLCCMNKHNLEKAGMKIAPVEVAKYFGHEHMVPETEGITPFLFHKWRGHNAGYPRFENPIVKVWLRVKAILRKLRFWR